MKKNLLYFLKTAFIALLLLSARLASGQIVFTSTPDSVAALNTLYNYTVVAAANPNPATFSLQTAPAGMTINSSSGLISWTPTSMSDGGLVVVKAQNSWGSVTQSYYIYISNAVECDENIISYWPMDIKAGTSAPELVHGYNGLWDVTFGPEPVLNTDAMVGKSIQFDPTLNEDWGFNVTDVNQYEFKADSQFSVSFWFKNKPRSITGVVHDEIFLGRYCGTAPANNNAGWYIGWNATTWKVEFYMRDKGPTQNILVSSQEVPEDNAWHHVVAAFYPDPANDSYMHLFVDGVETTALFDFWLDDFTGTDDLTLGYYYWATAPFSGLLDEVTVWNKELLPSDVTALRNKGLAHQPICAEGNVAPIITSTPVTTGTEDAAYSYTLTYRSMNGAAVTKSAPVKPSWLNFNATSGVLSGTPTNADGGIQNVTLRVSQGGIDIDQVFTINVANVNDAPVFTSSPVTAIVSKQQYNYWITATDEEGQTLTITCPTKPAWLTFSSNAGSGLLTGTPTRDNVGNADVTLQVTDGTNTTPQSFTIVVTLDNHVPVITSTAITSGMVDALYTYTITATDADAEALTYSAPTLPSWLTFSTSTHVLSGIPAQANLGNNSVVLAVTDGTDEVQQSFTINIVVNGMNDRISTLAKVYPVPASDFVILEFAERLAKADLQILSTTGDVLKKVDVSNLSSYHLDISDLKPTNYIYRIITPKGQQTGAIIKQ